ncbi:HAD family hydrolase [Desulforamulus ruminis]|uniref:Haloacid dehalogenase domain protein hydrolase n=1 Tax=Desulforamulus ruminis (strain ATCC 23193 / DSM 2154 / NCIMB 8452 / DL) TaxID=696281 RepID=F6DUZ5_DESRL|nr:HAD family hydrolase [Desulforamulus ruminis]AEG61392.1 Haloacid dehalogenase domain protein hydrolase [Desulforamulus ruminis DSM 2154]
MFKTILFDLDGTLLPMDLNHFLTNYFGGISRYFAGLYDPKTLQQCIWASTEAMIRDNRPDKTNQDVFMEDFFARLEGSPDQLMPLFDRFYDQEFGSLACCTEPTPLSRQICLELHEKGYQLVLATNPIFPDTAILHRMRWAGIHDIPWALVTTYENCHYCKPNPNYFKEILETIGAKPEETLMVGNDTKEDLIAGKLGIKTYLVTDNLIDHGQEERDADFEGRLEDFMAYARSLPRAKQKD